MNIYKWFKETELKHIKKYNLDPAIFFSDLNYHKLKILNETPDKYKPYIEFLEKPLYEYRDQFKNKYKILERFVRVDIIMPDNQDYKELTLIEIEPFASGHGYINNNKICIDMPGNFELKEKSSTNISLLFTVDSIIKNDFNSKLKSLNYEWG